MSYHLDDTIVAIASAPGGAIRGILRVSGAQVMTLLPRCFSAREPVEWTRLKHASAVDGWLQLPPPLGRVECLLYVWPNERSYTRQPSVEMHVVGSPPLLDAALRSLCTAGARLAAPGEFTLRAFLAGRLDLTQVEAVLGVIDARNPAELATALTQMAGGLAVPLQSVREDLVELLAHLEVSLDFVEEDLDFITRQELGRRLSQAAREVARIHAQLRARSERDEVPRVALIGRPNVGKSSLLNAFSSQSAAIVSPQPGTTRDYVTCRVSADGLEIELIDTAGFSTAGAAASDVEKAAQQTMREQARRADLLLLCLDATDTLHPREIPRLDTSAPDRQIVVWTKADKVPRVPTDPVGIPTSSHTGKGLAELGRAIHRHFESAPYEHSRAVIGTAVRCHESLRQTTICLRRACRLVHKNQGDELVAAEVHAALDGLGSVVGTVCTDEVLDRVFSRFCVGK